MGATMPLNAGQTLETAGDFFRVASPFLDRLDLFFSDLQEDFEPELRELVEFALGHSGKRLRPIALYLTANAGGGEITDSLIRAAAVVEMVHLATLVHDDILDEADLRHKQETVARKYGVSAAVLLGDALFAQALQLASRFETTEVCRLVSEATRKICAGEIEQSLDGGRLHCDIDRYYRIIERKTAVLFEVSCRLGAVLGHTGPARSDAAGDFGRHLGIAYQIYDDLADVIGSEKSIGKTLGTDFASGKSTLPLVFLFEGSDEVARDRLYECFRNNGSGDWEEVRQAIFDQGVVSRVAAAFHAEMEKARDAAKRFAGQGGYLEDLSLFVEGRFGRLVEDRMVRT